LEGDGDAPNDNEAVADMETEEVLLELSDTLAVAVWVLDGDGDAPNDNEAVADMETEEETLVLSDTLAVAV
jgi:hypothetical protein